MDRANRNLFETLRPVESLGLSKLSRKCAAPVLVLPLNDASALAGSMSLAPGSMSVQRTKSRVRNAVDFSHTHLIKAEEVLFVKVTMDNTASNATISSHMGYAKFTKPQSNIAFLLVIILKPLSKEFVSLLCLRRQQSTKNWSSRQTLRLLNSPS